MEKIISYKKELKTYWLVLQNKDVYFYENEDLEHLELHLNLTSCFIRENKEKIISLIDPDNLLWFLVPKEEHEYIYKDLAELGTTYFMSM